MDPLLGNGGLCFATFVYAFVSGIVPVVNCEVYLLWLAASAPRGELAWLAAAATTGQMLAKGLLFQASRGLRHLPPARWLPRPMAREPRTSTGAGRALLVFASALTGFPPFYALSAACGALGFRFAPFVAAGCLGRFLRFATVMLLPAAVLVQLPNPTALAFVATAGLALPAGVRTWRRRRLRAAASRTAVPATSAEA